ncbi:MULTISPECIES: EcsC family protein [unclassified Thermosynechococcus]|uniref:EcsC family protein n=1 Tax=unclassified Thermosynechococcus TaxID=2622553 RepID=UPI001A0A4D1B|nr:MULTISPECIES: EcsC family protein [unclassified Thermosynechococcus]HIK34398.1 EcsC family protein [Thermosynechococcus sp. M98_K2018_005]HIK47764.1 EcsC family protein [Thermosynechococcus sp. M55_K2018_012]
MTRNIALTDYEGQQIKKISAWLREETTPLQQRVQSVNATVERKVSRMLSPEPLAILCKAGDRLLANSDQAWQHLKQRLGNTWIPVDHWQDLKDQPLEVCDRLQARGTGAALTKAAVAVLITAPSLVTLSEELSGELIPVIGIALGVLESEQFAQEVATTARYVYQLRWLLRAHGGSGVDLACS